MRDHWVSGKRQRHVAFAEEHVDASQLIPEDPRLWLHNPKRRRAPFAPPPVTFALNNDTNQSLQVPLDLWLEIFTHLEPSDVLNLARTCKSLRQTLMHRGSEWLWKIVFKGMSGLPDIPTDWLSLPEFADLAFQHHCYRCDRDCRKVESAPIPTLWQFRARYCERCADVEIAPASLPSDLPVPTLYDMKSLFCRVSGNSQSRYHLRDVNRFVATVQDVMRPGSTEDMNGHILAICETQVRQTELISQQHSRLLRWMEELARQRAVEKETAKRRRAADIFDKLRKLGWETEFLDDPYVHFELSKDSQVEKREALTEEVWSSIRDHVLRIAQETKARWDIARRRGIMRTRLASLSDALPNLFAGVASPRIRPRLVDIALMPAVQTVLDMPDAVKVTATDFEPLRAQLNDLTRRWRADAKSLLLQDIRKAQRALGEEVRREINPFELARTSFDCTRCHNVFSSASVLLHCCQATPPTYGWQHTPLLAEAQSTYAQHITAGLAQKAWDAAAFDWKICAWRADAVIRVCGLDPQTATPKDMDSTNLRLACLPCSAPGRVLAMRWRSAVQHASECHAHSYQSPAGWRLLADSEAARAKALEGAPGLKELEQAEYQARMRWCCARCSYQSYKWGERDPREDQLQHILQTHNVAKPVQDVDFYLDPTLRPVTPRPVVLANETKTTASKSVEHK